MAEITIKVKHQGKAYDVPVDTSLDGEMLKMQLYSLTNVEPENQKIIAKSKMVKDDTRLDSLNWKDGTIVQLIGKPSAETISHDPPVEKMKFTEDMTEAELAQQEGATPAGLQNTGNTCYANASLQLLRSIPELQGALKDYRPSDGAAGPSSTLFSAEQLAQHGIGGLGSGNDLAASLRDLYKQMSETQTGFPPLMFLTTLRQKFPQFAERAKNGHGYAQQDAEEVMTQLVQVLHESLKLDEGAEGYKTWVDKYMGGTLETVTTCDDAPEEEAVVSTDTFHHLKCNIQGETNHLREGLKLGLDDKIEKRSASLGREATYTRVSRISRLPKHLTIQLVRFFWRKDTKKKAKILRKVTFQHEIDLTEFCTDELRKKLVPVRDQVREVRKEEEDVERAKKRQKRMREQEEAVNGESAVRTDEPLQKKKEKEKEKERELKATGPDTESELDKEKLNAGATQDIPMGGTEETFKTDEEIEKERAESILAAKRELLKVVHDDLKKDPTANQTGLYELRAVVTHQGSSADSGHYTAYVKKPAPPGKTEDGKWWWFNDEKVSEVESEKIETLAGGGESHSALILLYRAVELPDVPSS